MFTLTQECREYYNKNKDNFTHIVSIVCPDDDITPLHDNHLVVKFWDVDKTLENKFHKYDVVDVDTVLEPIFKAKKWYFESLAENKPMFLLVHCDAGISRSAAVSLGILWDISAFVFGTISAQSEDTPGCLRAYIDYRKEWCSNRVDDNCYWLRRFIDGRFKPGVKPNQAVLNHYRKMIPFFPW